MRDARFRPDLFPHLDVALTLLHFRQLPIRGFIVVIRRARQTGRQESESPNSLLAVTDKLQHCNFAKFVR